MSRKTLLILYVIFFVIFGIQLITREPLPEPASVRIIADAKSYTLPKTPIISLVNDTDTALQFNTCDRVTLLVGGISEQDLPPTLCREVEIPAHDSVSILGEKSEDVTLLQESFANISGKTDLRFVYADPESEIRSEVNTTIDTAGWIRLFFRHIFYNPVYNLFAALILLFP